MSQGGRRYLFTSEAVTMGHPDKVADQISDALLDAYIAGDPASRVAVETLVTTGLVVISGEVTSKTVIDVPAIARQTIAEIGYTDPKIGFDAASCGVITSLHRQSPDIDQGVTETDEHEQGAGDQGMMFGFACRETKVLMPFPIAYAHRLVQNLTRLREKRILPYLRPDGKTQVTAEYEGDTPVRVAAIVVSTQHDEKVTQRQIRKDIIQHLIRKTFPAKMLDDKTVFHINPTGRFVTGGPHGDTGLTGRKIIVDTYGGRGSHGGGAFSGKDPSKVDRCASYAARHVAKNIVAAGIADRCEVQLSYAIGVARPLSINVCTNDSSKVPEERIEALIREHFDLRPRAIIDYYNLRRPIYKHTARHGHFGHEREQDIYTWERTEKAEELRKAAGL